MEKLSPDQSTVLDLSHQVLVDLLPMAAYAVRAPDGVIVWYNEKAVEAWGRRPVIGDLDERFCGAHRLYFSDGTYMAHSDTPVAAALRTGASVHQEDVIIQKPDGSRVTVCVHIDPVRDSAGTIIGAVNFFYDVTARTAREIDIQTQAYRLEAAVQQRTASLSELSCKLMNAQDEERRRISRELHDGAGQQLALAKMSAEALLQGISSQDSALLSLAKELEKRLDAVMRDIRTLSHLFHPPLLDELGLAAAVRNYCEGFSARSGIKLEVGLPTKLPRFTQQMETALFRIIQESLTNIHRHSGASKATVSLAVNADILRLEVSDNGKGFDPTKPAGVGITGIRERLHELHGNVEIQSGQGSRIIANVPLNTHAKSQTN